MAHLELAWLWRKTVLFSLIPGERMVGNWKHVGRQLLEATSRIQDPGQFTSRKKKPKNNEQP